VFRSGLPRNDGGPVTEKRAPILIGSADQELPVMIKTKQITQIDLKIVFSMSSLQINFINLCNP